MRQNLRTTVAAITLATVALAGCGTKETGATEQKAAPTGATGTSIGFAGVPLSTEQARRASAFFGFLDYRYFRLDRVQDLGRASFVVAGIRGTVEGFEVGPQYWHDGGPNSGTTVIMSVRVGSTFHGHLATPGTAKILLPSSGGITLDDFARRLPPGTPLVSYLAEEPDLPPTIGEDLYVPASPQGLAIGSTVGAFFPLDADLPPAPSLAALVMD